MFLVILGFALLASAYAPYKLILSHISPVFFVGLRMGLAGLLSCGYYLFKRSPNLKLSHLKGDIASILTICFTTTFLPSVLKAYAFKYLISSEAVLIGSLDPFVTAIYAFILFSEPLTPRKFFGMCIGFGAVTLLVSIRHTAYGDIFDLTKLFSWPVAAAFGSMVIGRYGWIVAQSLMRKERYAPAEINGVTMLGSGVIALTTAYITGATAPLESFFNWQVGLPILWTVVVGNLLAYTLYVTALKKYPVTLISFLGFTVPIASHFYGWILLGEPLSWKFFLATSIASLGVFIYSREKDAKAPAR
jgi:drug/metabolite transporter (DMT)-like permease